MLVAGRLMMLGDDFDGSCNVVSYERLACRCKRRLEEGATNSMTGRVDLMIRSNTKLASAEH